MTITFKRRLFLLSLSSATCFLAGLLTFVLADLGIAHLQLAWFSSIVTVLGFILLIIVFGTWSGWREDKSEDTDKKRRLRNPYPMSFYLEAAAMAFLAVLLLAWSIARNSPTTEELLNFVWGLLVAGGCIWIGRLSSSLE